MAKFEPYYPQEQKLEGTVFENDPDDSGGCTKIGLTMDDLHEYRLDVDQDGDVDVDDMKKMTMEQGGMVLKKLYWDFFQADKIDNQKLAEFIVDSGLNQGRILIAKYLQSIIGVEVDGRIGNKTISALNLMSPTQVYLNLYSLRLKRYADIVQARPSQKKFYKGWMNRLNAIKVV